ncbi:unnamed protein product, partial [Ilex paraguariensis]
ALSATPSYALIRSSSQLKAYSSSQQDPLGSLLTAQATVSLTFNYQLSNTLSSLSHLPSLL